ncbi:MAG: hypothetical protein M1543_03365 [Firmicutes bacterium]|nr:hypothetical protein [Bacillota bacterium]
MCTYMLRPVWNRLKKGFKKQALDRAEFDKKVRELEISIDKLTTELAGIAESVADQPYEIRIDKIMLDKVSLDQIVFNIEGIDVKDLGGSLSIGLNYGGRVVRLESSGKPGIKNPGPGIPGQEPAVPKPPKKQPPKTPFPPPDGPVPQVKIEFGSFSNL